MGKYIGRNNSYGMFECQDLTAEANGSKTEFTLLYNVGSASSILVSQAGTILRPIGANPDYSIANGGTKIIFDQAPLAGLNLYVLYLGKELAVPSVAGNSMQLKQFEGDGTTNTYDVSDAGIIINKNSILVFKNGTQMRFHETDLSNNVIHAGDFYINSSNNIQFLTAPAFGAKLDFYILGIERYDLVTVDANSITTSKIEDGAVTPEKINLYFKTYSPTLTTFASMTQTSSALIDEASYQEYENVIRLRGKFRVFLGGTPDNKIRFTLPVNNNGSTLLSYSCTLSTTTNVESGIVRWGANNAFDVYRASGVNYTIEQYTIELVVEYRKV